MTPDAAEAPLVESGVHRASKKVSRGRGTHQRDAYGDRGRRPRRWRSLGAAR